eukprot:CAMPEP_0119496914 /NCGR_PEP_ID=MMETSP1344-20130328/20117_1 /TAXON_ID=236787 /ORGANISM="Florenciella parvula, Strain CCMP2471" /LENGTH=127 /DNA_ID=CAMNT_0007532653 /DNA_START=74 /DNA_END=453 /DNA_ORIENTATION=+
MELAAFQKEQFDPAAFVNALRANEHTVPLEVAQGQLRHQLSALKQQLYELINADYPQFMALAVGLQGVEEKAGSLRIPLLELSSCCEAMQGHARRNREYLETEMRGRINTQIKQRGLERCLRFSTIL